ncbi:Adenosylcobalamin/alpha-ribazole phosphatase [Roseobacter fucihabitans]|uniref:Adenosylcobalamin/alpha-ribazole phosphatase n=1 Tax=Roseobacter fucihabitans TaxID=1537242 RepID=A0ABZ2BZ86_9RHOB|nr:histidine phosphatase family protein [Roseobacter litoralis]MBC6964525.1 Alpha-ribazole phosphatase [Roseobacter litoralis]
MTTWHWVRHGPTHEKNFVGWRDVPADLSDKDHIQRLRAILPDRGLLVSSDLIRASATGDAIEGGDHTRLPNAPDIREFNFGVWDGMHFSAVAQRDPDLSRAYWENPGDVAPPEGESWNAAAARVNRFVDEINTAHPEADVIAVAHIGVILTQVQRGLGVSAYDALSHTIDNLSVTRIRWRAGVASVDVINHSA